MRCVFFLVVAAAVTINALPDSAYTDVSEVIITESLKRSEGRQYKLQAFGQEYELDLTPVDDVLPENLFVHVHTQNEDGTPDIEDWTHRTTGKQGLFADKKHHASIFINDAREDGVRMTGLVTEGIYIEPEDNINIDIDEKRSHVTVTHKLYKLKKPIEQTTEDDFEIDPESLSDDIKEKRATPQHIYVPIHVVVDYALYKKIGKPTSGVIEYIKVYYNAVNDLYSTISRPTVHISIQGITICTHASACPMVEGARLGGTDVVNSQTALDAISKWAYDSRSKTGEEYAAMMVMTGYDLCRDKSGTCSRSNNGLAWVATVCAPFRSSKRETSRTGIAEDLGNFSGVKTVAHEIGHLLGMHHDGDGPALPGAPGARSCPTSGNHIMGDFAFELNQWVWSKCSVEQLRWLTVQSRASCLLKKPSNNPYPLVNKLPGKQIDLDNQCKMKYGSTSSVGCREPGIDSGNDLLCLGLMCKTGGSRCRSSTPAAEGSYCGPQRYCRRGKCICDPTAPLPTAPPKDPNCQGDNKRIKIKGKSCVDLLSASDGLKNCNSDNVKRYCCESRARYCKATPISCDGKAPPTPKTTPPIDMFTTQPATARPTNNPNKNNNNVVNCGKRCVDTSNVRIKKQSCSALLSSTRGKQRYCDHPSTRTHCCATRKQLCAGYHWITESCDSQCQDNPRGKINGQRCVPFLQDTKNRKNFCHVSATKQHCCATRAKLCTSDPFGK